MPSLMFALLLAMEPLSLAEALSLALARHPLVAAAESRVAAAEAWQRGAGTQPNPEVRLAVTDGDPDEGANSIAQRLEIAGQPGLRHDIAAAGLEVARQNLEARRREVARATAVAWYEAWAAAARQALAGERLDLAQRLEGISRRRLESGEIAETAHLRTEFEVARALADLADAEAASQGAAGRLNLQIGRAPGTAVTFPEGPPEAVLAERPTGAPVVEAMRREAEATRLEAELVGRARAPDLELSAYRSRLSGADVEQGVQLAVVFPLFDYGRLSSEAERLRREAEAREHDASARALEYDAQVLTAEKALLGARARRDALERQVERARRMADLATRGYEAGLLSLPEVLDAQATFRLASAEFVTAQAAVRIAEADLHWGPTP